MTDIAGYHRATIQKRTDWTDQVFSLRVTGAPLRFKAGQFTKLALPDESGGVTARAYSLVNAPLTTSDMLEFLIVSAPQGKLSPKLQQLQEGDTIYVAQSAHGDLIFDTIPKQTKTLWLLSTGTGIGPFLSLLDDISFRPACEKIILVHGVREESDLVYRYLIDQLVHEYQGRLTYQPVVSRQKVDGALYGRITRLIERGELTEQCKAEFSVDDSFVMLCGNPEMIKDSVGVLTQLGLTKHRAMQPGNIIFERYW
ncbi:ferredoxin--NADP reductase [Vibrio panuliri]|uniref:ferredoxin--NADP(+) reductase n=1 Tax=Vibrio panuliri TaxID=1381081 RepID=A0A1Q9HQV9_9VIBR|nr:ferredoxin--NADP reductase [Vibrio panuliri]KAB1458153.1 ferredoxin--NADP reductase [Vibrio panuliri]OLQ89464.1 ferredoxin--NADP(+) reductase [Vibrio panuliri]OLQ93267.1 ferredoxin--NADP(+) reductase [Vibrio panuliri]